MITHKKYVYIANETIQKRRRKELQEPLYIKSR